jgi:TP901 family phage tail tape measure protein
LSEGLYDLVSSGFDASEGMKVLRASALAASAGLTTTEVSTKAVAAVINAYSLKASDAGRVSDTLFETVNRGVLTFEELASTIGDVLPFSAQLGISLNEVGASVSTMTKGGLSAPESMTRLKNTMVTLIKPGKALKERLDEIGMSGEELVKRKGFQGALEEIIAPLHGNKEAIAALFPNIRAMGGVLALTGINAKRAAGDLKAFKDTTGATNTVLKEQEKSFGFKLQRSWSELQAGLIRLGEDILPIVVPLLLELGQVLGTVVGWFADLPDPMQKVVFAGAALVALAGPMLIFASNVLTAAKNLGLLAESESATGALAGGKLGLLGKVGLVGAGVAASQLAGSKIGGTGGNLVSNIGTGAAIGAGVGSIVPGVGTLLGGAVGATGGAALSAFQKLTAGSRQLSVTQMKLGRDSKVVAAGMREQHAAALTLTRAEDRVQTATARHKTSTLRLHSAQRALNTAIAEAGPHSHAALAAERRLSGAIDAHRVALRKLHQAERLRGVQLSEFKTIARTNILNERNEINVLSAKAGRLNREYTALKKSGASQAELTTKAQAAAQANTRLGNANKRMAETLTEAASKAGPKFAHFLQTQTREVISAGSQWKAYERTVERVTALSEHLAELSPGAPSTPHGLRIPRHAAGTNSAPGGWSLVGERGPELMNVPQGARILSAPKSRDVLGPIAAAAIAAAVRGNGTGGAPLVHAQVKVDRKVLVDTVVEGIEDAEARR